MTGDRLYLRHILAATARIETDIAVGQETFLATPHWHDATIRQLEIVGEATKRLSGDLRSRHPDVPWRRIAGLRDVLIHNYMGVDLPAVWAVTQTSLPILNTAVIRILRDMGDE